MVRTLELGNCAFVVETYLKNIDSVMQTQFLLEKPIQPYVFRMMVFRIEKL